MRALPKGVWTFPPVLQQAGYETAYIGKSHIRPRAENPKESKNDGLRALGFDHVNCTGERYMLWKFHREGWDYSDNPYIQHLKKKGVQAQPASNDRKVAFSEMRNAQAATGERYGLISSITFTAARIRGWAFRG